MKAIILCAGYGTRLGDLTREIPKPMLEIEGRPLLEYTVRHLQSQGFDHLAINLHFQPEKIRNYFGDGSRWGVQIEYSYEPTLLGTAGALRKMMAFFMEEPEFLVHYGDVITNQDFASMLGLHRSRKALATLMIHPRRQSNSIIELNSNQQITELIERPDPSFWATGKERWVHSGVAIFSPQIFDFFPSSEVLDLPREVYPRVIRQGRALGFPLTGYRCAVDSEARLNQLRTDISSGSCTFPWSPRQAC